MSYNVYVIAQSSYYVKFWVRLIYCPETVQMYLRNLATSLSSGTNRFRLASFLHDIDQLIREVSRTRTAQQNTKKKKIVLKVS